MLTRPPTPQCALVGPPKGFASLHGIRGGGEVPDRQALLRKALQQSSRVVQDQRPPRPNRSLRTRQYVRLVHAASACRIAKRRRARGRLWVMRGHGIYTLYTVYSWLCPKGFLANDRGCLQRVRRGFTLTTSVVHRVSSKRERWMIRSLDELARAPEELVNRRALQTGVSCWPPRDTSDCARRRQGAWQTHQLSCYRPDRADQRKSCQTLLHSHSGDS